MTTDVSHQQVNLDKSHEQNLISPTPSFMQPDLNKSKNNQSFRMNDKSAPINYKNGRKIEPVMFNFSNYYNHREKLPQHYHPLVQYLENTEVKYHNDNLFENSPIGFPNRAQLLRERVYHLPILKDTPAEKARYRRKIEEKQQNLLQSRKKFEFKTYDDFSSHYFLTGARFNRNDTIDSKILNKYGVFVHRNNPDLVYIKSNKKALEKYNEDLEKMSSYMTNSRGEPLYKSKSVQVTTASFSSKSLAPDSKLDDDSNSNNQN